MSGQRPIWLDVARLVERACVGSLTGIDRVELAYAEALTAMAPERTRFVVLGCGSSRLVALPHDAILRFIDGIHRAWQSGHPLDCRRAALRLLTRSAIAPSARGVSPMYLLVSHRHLHREAALASALRRSSLRAVDP